MRRRKIERIHTSEGTHIAVNSILREIYEPIITQQLWDAAIIANRNQREKAISWMLVQCTLGRVEYDELWFGHMYHLHTLGPFNEPNTITFDIR